MDFPLVSIHPEAQRAAVAANCAGRQGMYWEMHHALFANQASLGHPLYGKLADDLRLNAVSFLDCVAEPGAVREVETDLSTGESLGVRGTPHFLVGLLQDKALVQAKRISGAQPFSAFASIIDAFLKQ